jgi:hypothetical protein
MKLYEFTHTDTFPLYVSLMPTEVRAKLVNFLKDEADLQGWADGYTLVIAKVEPQPESLLSWTYHLEVHGEYVEDNKEQST